MTKYEEIYQRETGDSYVSAANFSYEDNLIEEKDYYKRFSEWLSARLERVEGELKRAKDKIEYFEHEDLCH